MAHILCSSFFSHLFPFLFLHNFSFLEGIFNGFSMRVSLNLLLHLYWTTLPLLLSHFFSFYSSFYLSHIYLILMEFSKGTFLKELFSLLTPIPFFFFISFLSLKDFLLEFLERLLNVYFMNFYSIFWMFILSLNWWNLH